MSEDCPRRRFLLALGAGSATALSGCLTDDSDEQTTEAPTRSVRDSPASTPPTTTTAATTELPQETTTPERNPIELLHAWAAGDGADAFAALIEGFRATHPEVRFVDDPANGSVRSNLQRVVENRLAAGDPPSTWQHWPGMALRRFEDDLGDIGESVWTSDVESAYREGPRQQARLDGRYVTVPINIHRVNNLFYNQSVLDRAGVDPTSLSSPGDLLDALAVVESETDSTGLAHASLGVWTTVQLWETILLGQVGRDAYEAYVGGDGSRSPIEATLETVEELSEFYPADTSSISFTEANQRVIDGEAAFIHQGDWAAAAYTDTSGFQYGADWGQIPFPGTAGHYAMTMDSFTYSADNPSPEATEIFLGYCASQDGQRRFNDEKGSVPPRTDVDVSAYHTFQQEQYDDYRNSSAQPPSITHGLGATPRVRNEIFEGFSQFLESGDSSRTTDSLLAAFEE